MSSDMNATPTSSRLHIAIFGRRNAGKSSIINAITNQKIALVSDVAGTTTDPVSKAMELLPIGPVVIIDTAGLDDVGPLGELRIQRTYDVLNRTDLAVLVIDGEVGLTSFEEDILQHIQEKKIPVVGVVNKADRAVYTPGQLKEWEKKLKLDLVEVSAATGQGVDELKMAIVRHAPYDDEKLTLVGDMINPGDIVIMVVPIDKAAPKGRLILPQQQVIRDVLDHNGMALVVKEDKLKEALAGLSQKPRLVITDSQAFQKVAADTPKDVSLTSFSILMARYKGDLEELVKGARAIAELKPGDRVLIAEGCTHHRQSDDIGTVKIPRWLKQAVGGDLELHWSSGLTMPEDLSHFKLIVHCGACMLNRREMLYRIEKAKQQGVPMVNYGVFIAYVNGILPRALEPIPAANDLFKGNCA